MGKQASKHAECFLVNGQFNKALMEDQILKQTKTGFNLANYNLNNSVTELSVSLEDQGGETMPLRVELPPPKTECQSSKVLTLDNCLEKPEPNDQKNETDNRLSIEEFECGVQFESTEKNKQEWSFTLYDFDGQGKVTKEDLSSLLKALYDAVGSSIKIPSNGTKTLKLRLTVGPDGSLSPSHKGSPKGKDNKEKCKDSSKLKDVTKLQKVNNLTQANLQKQCNSDIQGRCYGNNLTQSQSPKRVPFTSQEHQQLAELVQENMERNHIKQLRRHHSDCRGNTQEHSHHKRRHRAHCSKNTGANNAERAKESQDRRNYYLDLAGIENTAIKEQNNVNCNDIQHQRSRSNELPHKCDNMKKEVEFLQKRSEVLSKADHVRSKSFDPQEVTIRSPKGHQRSVSTTTSPQKPQKFRPVSLPMNIEPLSGPPHYHRRHRQRDKDHDLAMQQVAEWIEKEHTLDKEGEKVIVQRHEHHHIHEHHHHHHYHHYHEA